MIKIEVEVRETDYDALIEQFLPLMIDRLRQSDSAAARLISAGLPESVIQGVLKKLPESAKDQLAAELINGNKEQLAKLLKDLAGQNGIRLEIGSIAAKPSGN
jgi:hypothetical protein